MAIDYPTNLDNFPNPQSTDLLDNSSPTLDHWTQHSNINDAVEALEAKVGVDGSAVTTTHDYKLSGVTGTDKAVSKTGSETLTNKTLTSPVINVGSDATGDMYYRNSGGNFTRLAVGASGELLSSSGTVPQWIANPSTADASTTVKGVVEIATSSEINSGTSTGGTGASIVVRPDQLASSVYATNSDFGDGSDGTVTINSGSFSSGPITNNVLTRDAFFSGLTIQTTRTLDTNGFRLFVNGTLTFEGTGKLINNGGNGGNGAAGGLGSTNAAGGTAGAAAATSGSLPDTLPGMVGGNGATAASGVAGSNGSSGTSVAKSLGSAGVAGASGGSGGTAVSGTGPGTGGTAGSAGSQTGTVFNKLNSVLSGYLLIDNQPTITSLGGSTGSGSSGGGGGGKSANAGDCGAGGGGGGSGAPGGIIWFSAKFIVTADGNVYAEANGGNGGDGGNGGTATGNNGGGGGGGGAGSGGSGGVIIGYYLQKTGTGTVSVAGGSAGTAGTGGSGNGTGSAGAAGSSGTAGATGQSYIIAII